MWTCKSSTECVETEKYLMLDSQFNWVSELQVPWETLAATYNLHRHMHIHRNIHVYDHMWACAHSTQPKIHIKYSHYQNLNIKFYQILLLLSVKMAQQVKTFSGNPDNLSLTPQNPHSRKREQTLESCPLTCTSAPEPHSDTYVKNITSLLWLSFQRFNLF